MNENILKGKWDEMKGEIRKTWGKLTDSELEQAKGDVTSISGLIQQRYGLAKEDIAQKLSHISSKYGEQAKEKLRGSNDEAKH